MKLLLALSLILGTVIQQAASQSLLANGNFEVLTSCPKYVGDIASARGWQNGGLTPDLFSVCTNGKENGLNVPDNYVGSKQPFDGSCYAGLVLFTRKPGLSLKESFTYTESIWTKLLAATEPGKTYCLSFWVALADSSVFTSRYLTATLSAVSPHVGKRTSDTQLLVLDVGTISDYANGWQRVAITFVATERWSYLSVGLSRSVFKYSHYVFALTQRVHNSNLRDEDSYYYLDNIVLSQVP